jgi:uncharacterized protein (TIGR00645 family)
MPDSRPPDIQPPHGRLNWTITEIGEAIYGIRWGLIPMYLGLWIGMIAYNIQFFREVLEFMFVWPKGASYPLLRENDSTHFLLWILSLIDITMIANLVVMTTVGGFSTFVKEYDFDHLVGRPRWMNGLDSSTLKIKMGMSLVGVSAIQLLKTFMEAEKTSWDDVLKLVLIHVVFILTTLAFTFNAKLLHGHAPAPSQTAAAPTSGHDHAA